jgi:site-specific recombinase XerD
MENEKEFTAYLERKGLAPKTQEYYLSLLQLFFTWAEKEAIQITKPDVLRYLEHLKNKGLQSVTRKNHLFALNHYFTCLYKSEQIAENPCLLLKIRGTNKRKLHKIYSPEELERLFDNYYLLFVRNYDDSHHRYEAQRHYSVLYRERNAVMMSILFHQGIITTEAQKIRLSDIDVIKATLKISGGKRLNERVLPIHATQIGLFINYLQNIRPQLQEYQRKESEKLFLPLPAIHSKQTDNDLSRAVFSPLATQLKSIDKQFSNFHQIRASVITYWIKTQGLRKAQHWAGHRTIVSTEQYVSNDLEDLTDDIQKLHPF